MIGNTQRANPNLTIEMYLQVEPCRGVYFEQSDRVNQPTPADMAQFAMT